MASHTIPLAPSSTDFWAPIGPPMSVATKPGQAELTFTPASSSSVARMRVIALSAALDTR